MKKQLILFDGVCTLCNGAVDFISKRDRKKLFDFLPLQTAKGQDFLKKHQLSLGLETIILFKEGDFFVKSDAALEIAKSLPRWKYLYVLKKIPRPLRDAVYDLIAKYRYRIFGKRDSCRIIE